MPRDYFKEDILENAISTRQRERRERREAQRQKKAHLDQKNEAAAQRAKQRRRLLLVALVAVLIAGVLVVRSIYQINKLQKEKAEAEAKLEELEEKIALLNSELKRVTSNEYIEQQARSQLKMIFPGETLYIIVPPSE